MFDQQAPVVVSLESVYSLQPFSPVAFARLLAPWLALASLGLERWISFCPLLTELYRFVLAERSNNNAAQYEHPSNYFKKAGYFLEDDIRKDG